MGTEIILDGQPFKNMFYIYVLQFYMFCGQDRDLAMNKNNQTGILGGLLLIND
jgi:hypothetical protein